MDERADLFLVEGVDLTKEWIGERKEVGGGDVLFDLGWSTGARNGAGDRWLLEDPAESELGEGHSGRAIGEERAQSVDGGELRSIVDSGEGFALIEGGAVAIEGAMVIGGKVARGSQLSRQHPGGEGETRQNGHLPLSGLREESLGRALSEEVVDDLDRLNSRILDRLECLLDAFDADAVEADLSRSDETIKGVEDLRVVVDICRRAVQLEEVERLSLKETETAFDKGGQVPESIAGGDVGIEPPASLGSNEDLCGALTPELGQEALAAAITVDIGSIEEVDAKVDRAMQRVEGLAIRDLAPTASDCPRSETDWRHAPAGSPKWSSLHHPLDRRPHFLGTTFRKEPRQSRNKRRVVSISSCCSLVSSWVM